MLTAWVPIAISRQADALAPGVVPERGGWRGCLRFSNQNRFRLAVIHGYGSVYRFCDVAVVVVDDGGVVDLGRRLSFLCISTVSA